MRVFEGSEAVRWLHYLYIRAQTELAVLYPIIYARIQCRLIMAAPLIRPGHKPTYARIQILSRARARVIP